MVVLPKTKWAQPITSPLPRRISEQKLLQKKSHSLPALTSTESSSVLYVRVSAVKRPSQKSSEACGNLGVMMA